MSHNTPDPDLGASAGSCAERAELAPATEDALLRRARDVIAGRVQPPPLVPSPEVEQFLRRSLADCATPTPAALRYLTDWLCLESQFGGEPVACFTTPAGFMVVLACGEREIKALHRGLPVEERVKVVITDTPPY
jgi:hypothetical protein